MTARMLLGVLVVLSMVSLLAPIASSASTRNCPRFRAQGNTFEAIILRGHPDCATVDKVLRAFMSGKGTMHGPPDGPAYLQSWTLYGWSCGHGAGGGACIRGGSSYKNARDWIEAQVA